MLELPFKDVVVQVPVVRLKKDGSDLGETFCSPLYPHARNFVCVRPAMENKV